MAVLKQHKYLMIVLILLFVQFKSYTHCYANEVYSDTLMVFFCGGGEATSAACQKDADLYSKQLNSWGVDVKVFMPTGNYIPIGNLIKQLPTRAYQKSDFFDQREWFSKEFNHKKYSRVVFVVSSLGWTAFSELSSSIEDFGIQTNGYDVMLIQPAAVNLLKKSHQSFNFDALKSKPRFVINFTAPDQETYDLFDEPEISYSSPFYFKTTTGPVWNRDYKVDGPPFIPTSPVDKHGKSTEIGLQLVSPVVRSLVDKTKSYEVLLKEIQSQVYMSIKRQEQMVADIKYRNPGNFKKWPGSSKSFADYKDPTPASWILDGSDQKINISTNTQRVVVFGNNPGAIELFEKMVSRFGRKNVKQVSLSYVPSEKYQQEVALSFKADMIVGVRSERASIKIVGHDNGINQGWNPAINIGSDFSTLKYKGYPGSKLENQFTIPQPPDAFFDNLTAEKYIRYRYMLVKKLLPEVRAAVERGETVFEVQHIQNMVGFDLQMADSWGKGRDAFVNWLQRAQDNVISKFNSNHEITPELNMPPYMGKGAGAAHARVALSGAAFNQALAIVAEEINKEKSQPLASVRYDVASNGGTALAKSAPLLEQHADVIENIIITNGRTLAPEVWEMLSLIDENKVSVIVTRDDYPARGPSKGDAASISNFDFAKQVVIKHPGITLLLADTDQLRSLSSFKVLGGAHIDTKWRPQGNAKIYQLKYSTSENKVVKDNWGTMKNYEIYERINKRYDRPGEKRIPNWWVNNSPGKSSKQLLLEAKALAELKSEASRVLVIGNGPGARLIYEKKVVSLGSVNVFRLESQSADYERIKQLVEKHKIGLILGEKDKSSKVILPDQRLLVAAEKAAGLARAIKFAVDQLDTLKKLNPHEKDTLKILDVLDKTHECQKAFLEDKQAWGNKKFVLLKSRVFETLFSWVVDKDIEAFVKAYEGHSNYVKLAEFGLDKVILSVFRSLRDGKIDIESTELFFDGIAGIAAGTYVMVRTKGDAKKAKVVAKLTMEAAKHSRHYSLPSFMWAFGNMQMHIDHYYDKLDYAVRHNMHVPTPEEFFKHNPDILKALSKQHLTSLNEGHRVFQQRRDIVHLQNSSSVGKETDKARTGSQGSLGLKIMEEISEPTHEDCSDGDCYDGEDKLFYIPPDGGDSPPPPPGVVVTQTPENDRHILSNGVDAKAGVDIDPELESSGELDTGLPEKVRNKRPSKGAVSWEIELPQELK